MLVDHPEGRYRFLEGIAPYSGGVVARKGYEIVFVTLADGIEWRDGFRRIEGFLDAHESRRADLCAIQLRCPAPYAIDDFIAFNREYCAVLQEWGLYVGERNPIARTNVAPQVHPPNESELYAFSYVRPAPDATGPTFVVSGAGELPEGVLEADSIVRRGETTQEALREKAALVMQIMAQRLAGLGGNWSHVNRVNVYTVHPVVNLLGTAVMPRLDAAFRHGVHLYPSHPPVREIEFEMDLRGVRCEKCIGL